ncbi:hypothetical protein MKY30_19870 [Oceanobacillus sp. FSL W8-0428]|uniref:FeS cluster biogenesis domain-containing protein n=1 Tax=Oceanobacillus sojae TaxID=582851 RepID=A0A511ZJ37_9BACI|nr:hypothetical protein [Oceanobacillus sojae]GEN87452.1 hypothetical protein OSO01_21910 [Oceanobacillus sojae]
MDIKVSEQVAKWYKEELALENEKNVRFFPRYGGVGGRIAGFSLGIKAEAPKNETASTTVEGIHFFVEESDDWYFEGANLSVSYDESKKEPKIEYPETD